MILDKENEVIDPYTRKGRFGLLYGVDILDIKCLSFFANLSLDVYAHPDALVFNGRNRQRIVRTSCRMPLIGNTILLTFYALQLVKRGSAGPPIPNTCNSMMRFSSA